MLNRTTKDAVEGWYSVALAKSKGSISSRVLKVQKGGSLSLFARATFDNEKIVKPIDNVPTIAEKVSKMALAAGALLSVQDINFGNETKSKSLNFNFLAAVPFVKTLLSKTKSKDNITIPYKPQKPKAYIEIAIYADSLQTDLLSAKQLPISDKGEYFWEQLQDSLLIEEDGFAVVSLRNESEKEVLFDELNVTVYGTERATIIQENHYEPFGMTLRGLDYVLEEKQKNKFLYNEGTEREQSLDLYLDETEWRPYDMQIGRMTGVDALADMFADYSPYVYAFNNPVNFNDPTGLAPEKESWEDFWKRLQTDFASVKEGMYYNNNGETEHSISLKEVEVVANNRNSRNDASRNVWHQVNNYRNYRSGAYSPYKYESFEEAMTGASLVGGDVLTDIYFVANDLYNGNYGQALISAVAAAVPGLNAGMAKSAVMGLGLLVPRMLSKADILNAQLAIILTRHSGKSKATGTNGVPNSIYTYLNGDGTKAVSNYIYNSEGKVIFQVDFQNHKNGWVSGHGHQMSIPGDLGSGHTPAAHIPFTAVPKIYFNIPNGTTYSTAIGF